MCESSIYVKHRLATEKEELVVRALPAPYSNMRGFYPYKAPSDLLVCTRYTTKAVIQKVRLRGLAWMAAAQEWHGKENVEVTINFHGVLFPDGQAVRLEMLMIGTRINIGVPFAVPTPKGMKMVEGAIAEAMALPPDPKPEDADAPSSEQPTEPGPAPEPKEPAEGDD